MTIGYFISHPIQYQVPLVRHLRDQGFNISVIYGPLTDIHESHDPELGRSEPWDIPLLDGYPHTIIRSVASSGLLGFFVLRSKIEKQLLAERPSVVWIHGWGNAYSAAAWSAAWRLGIPILLRGESHLQCLKGGHLRRWLHRQFLTRCFPTVSRFLAIGTSNREFYRSYGVPEHKIFNVPYAVENDRFAATSGSGTSSEVNWRRQLGIADDSPVIGFFGKLNKVKRPDVAIKAVAQASAQLPPERKPWLVFVGGGPLSVRMKSLASELYPERTIFLGFQNQSSLPALYGITDIILLPSDFEPWGLVVNEAMCGSAVPVVSDKVGAAPDLAANTGTVCPNGNVSAFADAIFGLLSTPGSLDKAKQKAKERIRTWSYQEDSLGLQAALEEVPHTPFSYRTKRDGVVAAYLGVHQVFQMGAAAAEEGILEQFYCSLVRFPGTLGEKLSRWMHVPSATPVGAERLPQEKVREFPAPLLIQRSAERIFSRKTIDPRFTNTWFANHVANALDDHPNTAITVGAETCALPIFRAAKSRGISCILDCHGIPTPFLQEGIDRAATEFGLSAPRLLDSESMAEIKEAERELADVLVLCSELQREIYLRQGLPGSKLRVVPLWVDTSFWTPSVDQSTPREKGPLRVLAVGAGTLAKGLPYLLEAVKPFDDCELQLTLAGYVHPNLKPLLSCKRKSIKVHPFLPKESLRDLYREHDVLVMPSLGDSFGFVAVEAMACGLPVILTDRCGAPVPDETWRVSAFSSESIRGRLAHYFDHRNEMVHDGVLGANFATQFTPAKYRQVIRAIYREILGEKCNTSTNPSNSFPTFDFA